MKKYRKLEIAGSSDVLSALLDDMVHSSVKSFKYNEELSNEYKNHLMDLSLANNAAVFKSSYKRYFECLVFVVLDKEKLQITNITSQLKNKLGIAEYNHSLVAFYNDVILPLRPNNVQVMMTGEEVCLTDLTTIKVAEALEKWEMACNKSMPTSHPYDEERWFEFVCLSAKSQNPLEPTDLKQWIVEDKQWPLGYEDEIEELVMEYEKGLGLLQYFIRHER